MNLHDLSRPQIFHKPAFLPGHFVIPKLQIWPIDEQFCSLAMMLPAPGEKYLSSWKSTIIHISDISQAILIFQNSPEQFVQEYFKLDITKLNPNSPVKKSSNGDGEHEISISGPSVEDLL